MIELLTTPRTLLMIAVVLCVLALVILFGSLVGWLIKQWSRKKQLTATLEDRHQNNTPKKTEANTNSRLDHAVSTAASLGENWEKSRLGASLLAKEDQELIDMAGYEDRNLARALFIFSRGIFAIGFPSLLIIFFRGFAPLGNPLLGWLLLGFVGFGIGWMLPKWYLNRRIKQRKKAINDELPLFIDILRLLQGVGLSVDQSLHTINSQFKKIIPILVFELTIAQDLYSRGRTREQSFSRLVQNYDNDELSAICRLIQQIDQYGGAVQEPLTRFSTRLQEQRKLDLKEQVGKLTVKMTGVMIITLLPALVIVTGGSGFLAVFRGLSRVGAGI